MFAKLKETVLNISRIDLLIGFFLLSLVMLTSWSLFRPEFFRVHDYVHGARIAELLRSAQSGHIPVRWTENFGYGYGMPLFEFYAPLPYYFGAFLYWLTNNLVLSTKALFLIANAFSVLGSYLLGQQLYGKKGGVIVAAAYSLAPYRAVNLFVRGAIGESWGMMMMPLALWAGFKVIQSVNTKTTNANWWYLLASLVGLFLSHNLSTLMYVPISLFVLCAATVLLYKENISKIIRKLFSLISSYVLAIGLSAFYLFPAILEKDFTIIESILSGYFYFSHHFLYIRQFLTPNWGYGGSAWGPDDGISFFLGYGQIFGVLLSLFSIGWFFFRLLSKKRSIAQFKKTIITKISNSYHFFMFIIFGLVTLGALYATLLKSEWWWNALPLISFIQFPWRWLSIAILFVSLLAGYGMIIIQSRRMLGVAVLVLISMFSINVQYFRPESFLDRNEDFYYSDPQLIRTEMSGILPDYIPKDLQLAVLNKPETNVLDNDFLPINVEGQIIFNEQAFDQSQVLVDRPHQKLVSIQSNDETTLEFATAWFPGWKAEIDGELVEVKKTNLGLVAVEVPTGNHSVGIYFGATQIRWWSDLVTVLSICIVAWLIIPSTLLSTTMKKVKK